VKYAIQAYFPSMEKYTQTSLDVFVRGDGDGKELFFFYLRSLEKHGYNLF